MVVTGQRSGSSSEAITAMMQAELRRQMREELKKELELQSEMEFDEEDVDNGQATCEFVVEAGLAVAGIYTSGPLFGAIRAAAAANTALKGAKVAKVVVDATNKVRVFLENVPWKVRAVGAVFGVGLDRVFSIHKRFCAWILN